MYGTALLLVAAISGFGGLPWPTIAFVALLLTIPPSGSYEATSRPYADVGQAYTLVIAGAVGLANNFAFSLMSYGLGRGAAWMLQS